MRLPSKYHLHTHGVLRSLARAKELTQKNTQQGNNPLLYQELTRHLTKALGSVQQLNEQISLARVEARVRIREISLRQIIQLINELDSKPAQSDQSKSRRKHMEALNDYIDLYVDVAILEERIAGNIPAVEGLRLIRERI